MMSKNKHGDYFFTIKKQNEKFTIPALKCIMKYSSEVIEFFEKYIQISKNK